jgi:drug/metabolite transporter (DMT)-like permease
MGGGRADGAPSTSGGRGVGLVAAGAALWGTDALFRRGLALELPAPTLVLLEHAVLVLLTAPWLWRGRLELRRMNGRDWISAVVIGGGSSTLATVLFTSAFRYGDPTTPLLLQKIQPLVAVVAARLILGESVLPRFGWFLAGGLSGAYLIAFPDPASVSIAAFTPAFLAAGAAALWGLGTVLGRRLLRPLSFQTLTSLRFTIGLPAAAIIVGVAGDSSSVSSVAAQEIRGVVALALVPGLAALMIYYRGLRSTPASAASLAELAFPLTAAGLNFAVFGTQLSPTQTVGAVLLAGTITAMGVMGARDAEAIGVRQEPARLAMSEA